MAGKNQNKPPFGTVSRPSTPSIIKGSLDDVSIDTRRRTMIPKMGSVMKARPALSIVNGGGRDLAPATGPATSSGSDGNSSIEFTMEKVDELLNEKNKSKNRFNYKEKCDEMQTYIKRLKLCIRWFQELEENRAVEQQNLRASLEMAENRSDYIEMEMNANEEKMNLIILDLTNNYTSLQERFTLEESDKLALMEALAKEKETRIAAEKLQISLSEDLQNCRREASSATQTILSINDMNKQLQEYTTSLQQYNCKLQSDIAVKDENFNRSEKERAVVVECLGTLRVNHASLQDQFASLKASNDDTMKQKEALDNEVGCIRNELQRVRDERDLQVLEIKSLRTEVVKYKQDTADLDRLTLKSEELETTCASQSEQIGILQGQLVQAENKLQMADLSANRKMTEYEDQEKVIHDLQCRLTDAELKLEVGEKLRKDLHNTIMELKGNIRVFCRVRPLLPEEGNFEEAKVISYPVAAESLGRGIHVTHNGKKDSFTFDRVFTPEGSQEDVFVEIEQLVQSALDGYRVCIFAYGQTGSGKTYTMMGRLGKPDQKGMIPRSLEQIFKKCQEAQDWRYEMKVYVLEIYNETIRDLLSSSCPDMGRITENGKQQYTIKHDQNGNTWVPSLTVKHVESIEQVYELLNQAEKNRSVGKTQMNEESSRSHFVFTLHISGINVRTGQQVEGILNLIDLAGSERLSKSGSTGDRLKETQAINTSLSALTDVIYALANKQEHVPFRNSKLTYLLKPCLEGDSKVLMFVNISPDPSSASESLNSVKFAARVNACEIGTPRRQPTFRSASCRLSYG
ncbi:kinesin-like protein KIN-14N [Impatiens glandulifera]|uniref:kinesin-like protein KIN-14N n=1 Tax=Impatiens glandulifera TaxID=253017 RepID=UPI001FB12A01|nr:kinesin-like protein KIN-14N [Impatiens glandulifera]